MTRDKKNKVFIIGLDGATFDIINPMIAKGELPNIAAMMQKGSSGILKSCIPDLSPPAWTSFMTGKHPGKHGILDFFCQHPKSYETTFFNATFRKAKPIWTLLSEIGKKVCVMNVPLTFPPDKVNGIMISGMDTPDINSDFMYPASLRREFDESIGGYELETLKESFSEDTIEQKIEALFKVTKNRSDAAKYLLEKDEWDLFVMVFEATDRSQHEFWKYMDPMHPEYIEGEFKEYEHVIFETYKDVDARLGELLRLLPDNATIVILSDHGFGPLYKGVRLEEWLKSNAYLSVRHPSHSWKASLIEKTKQMIPRSLKNVLKKVSGSQDKPKKTSLFLDHIDMSNTKVYPMGGHGQLCINLSGRQPQGIVEQGQEYETLRDELILKIQALKDPVTGTRVIEKACKREEVYSVFPENTPDILLIWNRGYYFVDKRTLPLDKIRTKEESLFTPHKWSGVHQPDGIVIFKGNNIKAHHQIHGAEITDIAPTILSLLGMDILDDMDGRVLTDIMTDSCLESTPIKYQKVKKSLGEENSVEQAFSEEDSEKIRKRLRDLGYIE